MAREFARVQEFYLPLHELQPAQHYHHLYELHQPSTSTAPAYELTAGASGSVCVEAAGAHAHGRVCAEAAGAHAHGSVCAEAASAHAQRSVCAEAAGAHAHGSVCAEAAGAHAHGSVCAEVASAHAQVRVCAEAAGAHVHGSVCAEKAGAHVHESVCAEAAGAHVHGSVCAETAGAHAHTPHATIMQQRKSAHCSEMSNCETMLGAPHPSLNTGSATWHRTISPTYSEPECEMPVHKTSLGAPQAPLNAPTPVNRKRRLLSSHSSDNCEMPVGESSLAAPLTPLNAPAVVTRRRSQISSYLDNCEMPVMKTSPQTPQTPQTPRTPQTPQTPRRPLTPRTPLNAPAHVTRRSRLSSYSSENYEMAGCETSLGAPQPPLSTSNSSSRKRRLSTYSSENYEMAGCETPLDAPHPSQSTPNSVSRNRRISTYGTSSTFEDDGGDDSRSSRTLPDKKQNHSEIEKRRRDKMNTYISELSSMIPMCGAMARKLDKLTVLRMAVQHIRSVHGAQSVSPLSARPRPSFLSEPELNQLILDAAHDCFLLVVGCDRGRLLYVSASVKQMLHYDQSDLLGQSLFDILHPKDVAKVKEQLSSSDLSPRERLIDAKTMLPVRADVQAGTSRLCPGARRSFFCRIKCKVTHEAVAEPSPVKDDPEPPAKLRKKSSEKKYCVVQCTGYLKSWLPAEMSEAGPSESAEDGDAGSLSCLVGVARALPDLRPAPAPESRANPLQFMARHAPDTKFLFVDQRVTLALGFLPQELIGTSLYEYVSVPDLGAIARAHKVTLENCEQFQTMPYSFRRKDGTLARLHTHFKPIKNPWTREVEGLVANNTILSEEHDPSHEASQEYDLYRQTVDVEMQQLIESQVESHKIGSAIAEEALRRSASEHSTDLSDLLQDPIFNLTQPSLVDSILGAEAASFSQVRNNVPLSAAASGSPPAPGEIAGSPPAPGEQAGSPPAPGEITGTPSPASPLLPPLGLDGNGEAAMAVIMSLLEADAGLGGPVNFSGLPWPLP